MEGRKLGLIFLRLIPACATKTRGFSFLHSKYSRSCSTIQHHYDSPGMTKARDPRPARKTVGWLASLALYKCRAFSPRVESCCYFKPGGGYQPDKVKRNRDRSGKLGLACNQNTADVLRNKKLVAPTSVGATSLNAVAQGFEPWVAVTPHSISSAAPSAARTRYLGTPQ